MRLAEESLRGQVAIVTGAGKGLGRSYALELAARGACVVVNNRTTNDPVEAPSADAVVAEIGRAGGTACADYSSAQEPGAGQGLVDKAISEYGRLDIVLSNAGGDRPCSFHKQSLPEFEAIVEANFLGAARLVHAAWSVLRDSGYGRVLVSTSSAGLYGNHGQAAYSCAKAALLGLVRSLATEGAQAGIVINAIAPYAATALTRPWFADSQAARFDPVQVAPVAAWLVSNACTLNGATVISGAGGVRLAGTRETDTRAIGDDPGKTLAALQAMAFERSYDNASAEFADFARHL
jgi:NAD(P)-dependent dehydrogenase (short-subunit alcohol dehydrogenase family)